MNILIAGYSVRHIACSAAKAGHEVGALDGFCDLDLQECVRDVVLFPQHPTIDQAEQIIKKHIEDFSSDAIVLGPGLEEVRVKGILSLNNPPEKAALVSDKLWLARFLEQRGFPFVPTYVSADDASYPAVIKPRRGAGGIGCCLVESPEGLKVEEGSIIQDFLPGIPASVSVIGTGHDSKAIAVNEQLIGAAWAGAEDFRYSGNITPLDPPHPELPTLAEEVISRLGLVGTNGVDFLLTEHGPVIVEVNARFQGSLDTVELSTGMNVFQAHLKSFEGSLPELPRSRLSAGRAILFAKRNLEIIQDLRRAPIGNAGNRDENWIADVPASGSQIKKNDPVASVLAKGSSRKEVLALLMAGTAALDDFINLIEKEKIRAIGKTTRT
jgi:predicted ATP-grasp superfamily ATP-dependent carboligase